MNAIQWSCDEGYQIPHLSFWSCTGQDCTNSKPRPDVCRLGDMSFKVSGLILISLLAFSACKKKAIVDTSSNMLTDITSQAQFDEHIQTGVSLVFFHASWCTICKEQRPAVEELTTDSELAAVKFGELEYDDLTAVANKAGVKSFPTIVIFKNSAEVTRLNGKGHSKESIKKLLTDNL